MKNNNRKREMDFFYHSATETFRIEVVKKKSVCINIRKVLESEYWGNDKKMEKNDTTTALDYFFPLEEYV